MATPRSENETVGCEVRKIKNGFIARHTSYDGKGNYQSHEVYHDRKPVLAAEPTKPAPAKKPAVAPAKKGVRDVYSKR